MMALTRTLGACARSTYADSELEGGEVTLKQAYTSPKLTSVSLEAHGQYTIPCFSSVDIGTGYDFAAPAACVPKGTACRDVVPE